MSSCSTLLVTRHARHTQSDGNPRPVRLRAGSPAARSAVMDTGPAAERHRVMSIMAIPGSRGCGHARIDAGCIIGGGYDVELPRTKTRALQTAIHASATPAPCALTRTTPKATPNRSTRNAAMTNTHLGQGRGSATRDASPDRVPHCGLVGPRGLRPRVANLQRKPDGFRNVRT